MDLSFGSTQVAVLVGFFAISAALIAIFAAVAIHARRNLTYAVVADAGYRLRSYWFAFLGVLLATGVILSVAFLPYGESAGPTTTVEVTGYQFNWNVAPDTVPAGTTVTFDVTSSDVNHGLAIYDPGGVLIANVQAMPGYHNELELTLDQAGTYMFGCLELCGLDHHRMIREFEVTR